MAKKGHFHAARECAVATAKRLASSPSHDLAGIIAFGEHRSELSVESLAAAQWDRTFGTNLVAGFIAGRRLLEETTGRFVVFGDFEPTAHLLPDGDPIYGYPPSPETIRFTVDQILTVKNQGSMVDAICFDAGEHRSDRHVLAAIEQTGGDVIFVTPDDGEAVVEQYLLRRWS